MSTVVSCVILLECRLFFFVDVSPLCVFDRHAPKLVGVVSNTDRLIADLVSAGVIAEDGTSDSNGVSSCQSVEVLLSRVRSCLVSSSNPEEMLVKFSIVLKNQSNETIRRISTDMKC